MSHGVTLTPAPRVCLQRGIAKGRCSFSGARLFDQSFYRQQLDQVWKLLVMVRNEGRDAVRQARLEELEQDWRRTTVPWVEFLVLPRLRRFLGAS